MSLFSTTSISLGITFSNDNILAVRLDQEKGLMLSKEAVEPDSISQGTILNEQGVLKALTKVVNPDQESEDGETTEQQAVPEMKPKLWERMLRRRSKRSADGLLGAAICIPPEAVYTAVFAIPAVVGKDLGEEVLDHVAKTIPIHPDDMTFTWKQVGKSDDNQYVAVAAMSKLLLNQYKSMCEKQKLRLECVTIPSSTIWLSAASHQKDSAVLIARLNGVSAISAVIYNTWPVDEVVLPEGTSFDEQIEQTKQMVVQQYDLHNVNPKRVVFIGSDEDFSYLQQKMGGDIPVERTTFAVPSRLVGFELGLFPILSARKDKLINMLDGVEIEEEES